MRILRRPLARFLFATLLALVVVTTASVVGVWWAARAEAEHNARVTARSFARAVVSPLRVTDLERTTDVAARTLLDRTVADILAEGEVYRIKIWRIHDDEDIARIVYSDLDEIEGLRVPVSSYLRRALETSDPVVVPLPNDEAHAHEQRPGERVVEVYQTFTDADGTLAVAELYLITQTDQRIRAMLTYTLPAAIGGPVLLAALTLPLSVRLARRVSDAESERRELVERALAASETERRRLARLIHDGPVQDLAALGVRLERAQAGGGDELAAEQVRAQIGKLRDLLDDLDPVEVTDDMKEAFGSAADGMGGEARVTVTGDDLAGVESRIRALVHRCGVELLRNALTHSGAAHVWMTLQDDGGRVTVRVSDDGSGFDPSRTPRGHHGLTLVRAAVEDAGGTMTITSGAEGTTVVLRLPRRDLAPGLPRP
ncbi:MAG: ATP-binding protein [Propioniciclava sp.]|uniref:sensor histidine kinase n=1 Tax=Propioniciclava sp. TaxID=2038686 RepID=UPI0039E66A0C